MLIFAIVLAALSLITFTLYGVDKARARHGAWRIPERTLLLFSLLGGAIGGLAAMQAFRHKTRHWYFYAVNVAAIALHVAIFLLTWRAQ